MAVVLVLSCVAVLLATSVLAVGLAPLGRPIVYGTSLVVSLVSFGAALNVLLGGSAGSSVSLPLGLPWIGAHFRLDALAAVFLIVVGLGGAAASLYALGYGRHEPEPQRVLPFYPSYLAAMKLVVLADDAFSFLVAWELMSLASWGLVVASPTARDIARRLHLSAHGEFRHAHPAARFRPAGRRQRRLRVRGDACDPPVPRSRRGGADPRPSAPARRPA